MLWLSKQAKPSKITNFDINSIGYQQYMFNQKITCVIFIQRNSLCKKGKKINWQSIYYELLFSHTICWLRNKDCFFVNEILDFFLNLYFKVEFFIWLER
jgi:hypothetical protein